WSFNVGIRGDIYNGLSKATQAEPRLGIAYNIKQSNTVLRISYARTLESPFNENLVLSSRGCLDAVVANLFAATGEGCTNATTGAVNIAPSTPPPGYRNEFHAGLQQAFGKYLVVDGEYIWKYTHNAYDFSILGNTPVTFPIAWNNSKIPGWLLRASVPNFHGITALVVMSSVAARYFPPQVGGLGVTGGQSGSVFRIDHDEKFTSTMHLQYQPWKTGPWVGFNWRYDSGLVAGQTPCFGGNCAQTTTDSTGAPAIAMTDSFGVPLTADQEFESGLFCGSQRATPTMQIGVPGPPGSPSLVCPLSAPFGSTLLQVPAPNTENDDKNPPRIASWSLFDIAVGHDNLFHGDKYKVSLQFTAINITNKYALYNFLSTFSGTHYVTPRALTAQIGFNF